MNKKTAFLSLGSNAGNRMSLLCKARNEIAEACGDILNTSGIYETEPWGNTNQPLFLNQVLQISTRMEPVALLRHLLEIEKKLGRTRGAERWTERTIDIDILLYESCISNSKDLTLPHPEMEKRRFILVPMTELASDFIHPVSGKPMGVLLQECTDRLKVIPLQ